MSESESTPRPQAGHIWSHQTHDYRVLITRITDRHIHYRIHDEGATEHARAAKEFLQDEFGYSLAYIAPTGGSCLEPAEFQEVFVYEHEREKESYENW